MRNGVTYQRIDDAGLHISTEAGPELLAVDHVVICAGQESVNALARRARRAGQAGARDRRRVARGGARCRARDPRRRHAGGEAMSGNDGNDAQEWGQSPFSAGSAERPTHAAKMGTVPCIRVSARARRLSIRVYPDARVEVVVPPRARPREVEQFIAAHREWIDSKRAVALRNRPGAAAVSARQPSTCGRHRRAWRLHLAGGSGPLRLVERRRRSGARPAASGARSDDDLRDGLARLAAARRARPARAARGGAGGRHRRASIRRFRSAASVRAGEVARRGVPSASTAACCSSGPKWWTTSSCMSSCT